MSFFQDVKPGDRWKPEPASRYNAVNRMLSDLGYSGAGKTGIADDGRCIVSVVNRHTEIIQQGTAIEALDKNEEYDLELVPIKVFSGGILYGIALDTLSPGDGGRMLLTGVATVRLSAALPEGTRYVEPGADGLFQAATGGRAQVISTKEKNAIILLGAGDQAGYNGFFKVIDASETAEDGTKTWKIKVVDGTGHVSYVNSCGYATVNEKTYPVYNAEIEIPAKNNVLKNYYLYLKSQPISSSYTTPEFELLDDIKLEMEQDVGRTLIAMIYFNNKLDIFQVSTGIPRILIWGKCEDENVQ